MLYSIQRLCEERLAVVLVDRRELAEPRATSLLQQLQTALAVPVMLVARDNEVWTGARARADFDPKPHLYALLGMRDIDWAPLPDACHQVEEA
jgi:hypothetical protein